MGDLFLLIPFEPRFIYFTGVSNPNLKVFAKLLNIPGQEYTIGSKYPGKKENNEFIFSRGFVNLPKIQCHINVNEKGQFYIRNALEEAKTFLNGESLETLQLLKTKDIISFEAPLTLQEHKKGPVFQVVLRSPRIQKRKDPTALWRTQINLQFSYHDENVLNNELILSTIFGFLKVRTLKKIRLVSKHWNVEATKHLERRATLSFKFKTDYIDPKHSTAVFRYGHHNKGIKLRKLKISTGMTDDDDALWETPVEGVLQAKLYHGEPWRKIIDDLDKVLNFENNFTSLHLQCEIKRVSDFQFFHKLAQAYGGKLEDLILGKGFMGRSSKEILASAPISLPLLKRYTHLGDGYKHADEPYENWASKIVPEICKTLEEFCCEGSLAVLYFKHMQKVRMESLRKICIVENMWAEDLNLLLQLNLSLTKLTLESVLLSTMEEVQAFEELIRKNAQSLVWLKIGVDSKIMAEFVFPSFPNLRELSITFGNEIRIRWENEEGLGLDYVKHFPVLQILEINAQSKRADRGHEGRYFDEREIMFKFNWENEEDVFSSFFPENRKSVCKTVTILKLPSLKNRCASGQEYRKFQIKICNIAEMFPNVIIKPEEGLGISFESYRYRSYSCSSDGDEEADLLRDIIRGEDEHHSNGDNSCNENQLNGPDESYTQNDTEVVIAGHSSPEEEDNDHGSLSSAGTYSKDDSQSDSNCSGSDNLSDDSSSNSD